MLVLLQFPFADLRRLVTSAPQSIIGPDWRRPPPDRHPDFIRGFGALRKRAKRSRTSSDQFPGEAWFARAGGGIRLPQLTSGLFATAGIELSPYHAVRRVFSDGWVMWRVEVGVALRVHAPLSTRQTADAARDLLSMPVSVRIRGHWTRARPLIEQGAVIGQALTNAGSSLKEPPSSGTSLRLGSPMVLIESTDVDHLQAAIPTPTAPERGHWRFGNGGPSCTELDVFTIKMGIRRLPLAWLRSHHHNSTTPDITALRVNLFRLHAERENMTTVLHAFSRKDLDPSSIELQRYLGFAEKRLLVEHRDGMEVGALRDAFNVYDRFTQEELESIRAALADFRQTRERAERLIATYRPSDDRPAVAMDRPPAAGRPPLPVMTIRVEPGPSSGKIRVELHSAGHRPLPPQDCPLDISALTNLEADAEQYGEHLGRALFGQNELGRQLDELRLGLVQQAGGFRVRLRLDDEQTRKIRWERLVVPWGDSVWRPLATTASTPLSRVAYYEAAAPPVKLVEGELRALLVIASPSDLPPQLSQITQADREVAKRALTLGPHVIDVVVLESGTSSAPSIGNLRAELAKAPHLVHVLCHGAMEDGGGVLYIEDRDGGCMGLSAAKLAEALEGADQHPRLVFLAACESASPDSAAGLRSVAPVIVARGADAVLAMHGPLSIPTANAFTTAFYNRLYAHGQPDVAAAEARAAVKESWDWSVPVLFMRHDSGRVIDFDLGGTPISPSSEALARALHDLPATAGRNRATELVVGATRALQTETVKSHEFLVEVADAFRGVGADPMTFRSDFEQFQLDFERKSRVAEKTSGHRISEAWNDVRPFLSSLVGEGGFDVDAFRSLDRAIQELSLADPAKTDFLDRLLDTMKTEMNAIKHQLDANDVAGAIAAKCAFERRLADSLRRSEAYLQTISHDGERAPASS